MTHELKPCPFCGGPAAEPDENNHTSCTTISCGSTAYMSVPAWNERQSESALESYLAAEREVIRNNPEDYITVGMAQDKIRADLKATGKLLYDLCDAYAACNGEDHPAYCEARRFLRAINPSLPPIIRVEGETQ